MAFLEVSDIAVAYGSTQALRGVSVKLDEGELATLIGANGAGKSTTLRALCGEVRPTHGGIALDGESLVGLPPHVIARKGVVQCPEGRRIFGSLTVQENLDVAGMSRSDREGARRSLRRVFELFPRLSERQNQLGGTLSGGEQQMLAIGRALMAQPRVLLLDEPSLGLAPILVEAVFEAIKEINRAGTTVLLVEQNAYVALRTATYGYVLETGRVVLSGSSADLLRHEEVLRAYLG